MRAVAGAAAALELTVDYVRERQAFGKPIGALQNTRFRLAELATEIDIAQAFVDRCVPALNEGDLTAVDAAKAKWWTTELLWPGARRLRPAARRLRLHARSTRSPRPGWTRASQRIYAGTTEIMKDLIGRSMKLG